MKEKILAMAATLSDQDLLACIETLAGKERDASVELVAHLAVLDLRPSLYAALGYGSLFAYCTQALRLPEDVACNRIQAARACRRFPQILELLASGSLSFSTVRMLRPHLTETNHESVLARAVNRRREEIEALVAELAPRADVAASVRKAPSPSRTPEAAPLPLSSPALALPVAATPVSKTAVSVGSETAGAGSGTLAVPPPLPSEARTQRPIVQALAPQRYRVQFTIGQEAHDQLRGLQALLRREIPNGDAGLIFERALALLSAEVQRAKLGAGLGAARMRTRASKFVRSGADKVRPREGSSRHISNDLKRAVWQRDRSQCAFVSAAGHRCTERSFLELHHIQPYALDGPATAGNISLRCWRHNQYEAELVFGARAASLKRAP